MNRKTDGGAPVWVQLFAPAIAVVLVGFLVLNVAATRMRSVHLQRLEAALKIRLPYGNEAPTFHTDAGIVYRPDHLLEAPRVRLLFATITFVAYGTVNVIMIGFTWTALVVGPWTGLKVAVAIAYGIVESIEILGFIVPLRHHRFIYEGDTPRRRSRSKENGPGRSRGIGMNFTNLLPLLGLKFVQARHHVDTYGRAS